MKSEELVSLFTKRSLTLATCESLTGGLIGAAITSVPGSSKMYRGGIISYAKDLKASLVKVDEELITHDGVVNELTALQMAIGTQAICDSDWAVATTGVAGPTELDGQPVGTVWFAIVGPKMGMSPAPQYTEKRHFEGDREAIRQQSTSHAIEMLVRVSGVGE